MVSIQLVSPTSGERVNHLQPRLGLLRFHSISFPNEWGGLPIQGYPHRIVQVSIQLVSPTSGEGIQLIDGLVILCFHSISFPNEWGVMLKGEAVMCDKCFHSISFPNEWGVSQVHTGTRRSFHSISFPNEWGANEAGDTVYPNQLRMFPFN